MHHWCVSYRNTILYYILQLPFRTLIRSTTHVFFLPKTTWFLIKKEIDIQIWVEESTNHYRSPALCRVPGGLPSVVFRALGKDAFAECFFLTLGKEALCRVFFLILGKEALYRVFFLTLGKELLCRVLFFYTRQRKFQSTFWSSKLIQMKNFSTIKLYNSSRCTMFVLVFSSYDKVKVNLFTNLTYLS